MRISRRKCIVVAAAALISLLLYLTTTFSFQQWLLRRAEYYAARHGFPFSAERLHIEWSRLKLSLSGFVYDQNGQSIRIERLTVDFPWNAVLNRGQRISDLQADGIDIVIHSTQVPELPVSGGIPSLASRVRIDHLKIRNASVLYSTPATLLRIPSMSLEATNGRGALQLDAPISIGSATNLSAAPIPIEFDDENIRFGPANWNVRYTKYHGSGSARGVVRWSPELALDTDVTTDRITIDRWKILQAALKASYRDGTWDLSEFRVTQKENGEITGSAKVSASGTYANVSWKNLNLTPAGLPAHTDGTLKARWSASDMSDLSGEAEARMSSRQYGNLHADIRVAKRKAAIDIRASTADLAVRAHVDSGLERALKGDFTEIRGTVRGNVQPLSGSAKQIGTVDISAVGQLRNSILTVRDIRAQSRESLVSGATFQINLNSNRIRGSIPQMQIALHDFAPDVTGAVALSADVAGTLKRPTATFTVSSDELVVRSIPINNITLIGAYVRNSQGLAEGRGVLTGTVNPPVSKDTPYFQGFTSINLSAGVHLLDDTLTLQGIRAESRASAVENAELQIHLTDHRILGSIPQARIDSRDVAPNVVGSLSLTANIEGTTDQPTGTFSGNSTGLDIGKTHIDSVGLDGMFTKDSVSLTRLDAQQSDGRLSASGFMSLVSKEVHATAEVSDLKVTQLADLSANVSLKARVDGNYRSPDIKFVGDVRNATYRREDHGTVHFEGKTNLKDASVSVDSERYSSNLKGHISIEAPYAFTATLKSSQSRIHYDKYNGIADGEIHLSGQARPFRTDRIEFENFTLHGEGIEIAANGPMDTGTQVDLKADLAKLPVKGLKLDGTAQAHATVSGAVNNPLIEGLLTTDHATVQTGKMKQPADLAVAIDFTGHEFSIRDAQAGFAGATATVTGRGSWKGDGQFQFRIANLRPENFANGRPISGIASVEGELDVHKPRLDDIEGTVRFTELQLAIRDATIQQKDPIEADLHNHVLTLRRFEIEGPETHANLSGFADLRQRTFNIDIDADTNLTILEPFLPDLHPAGRLQTQLSLRGTSKSPSFDGFINITDGEMTLEQPEVHLGEVNLKASLTGNRIEISYANGKLNDGDFSATGGTNFSESGLRDAAFQLKVERGQLEYPEGLQSEFSTELMIEGSTPQLTIRGNIDVINASYEKNFRLTQEVLSSLTTPQGTPTGKSGSSRIGDQLRLELEVQAPGTIFVKNNIADLEATGSFRIRGTASNPIVLGHATVLEGGELYFGSASSKQSDETSRRSNRYTVQRGSIDFNNPQVSEPNIDFEAKYEMDAKDQHYVVTLRVRGTPKTLKAELTSDPYLAQSDIVALLLTGHTYSEVQGRYAFYAGELALGYLSGELSDRWLTQAGNVVGLSYVTIDPVIVANQTDLAAKINVVKEIVPGFALVYSQNLNGARAQSWIIMYRPKRSLLIRGVNDTTVDEYRLEIKQDLRLGGPNSKTPAVSANPKLRDVTFTGSSIPSSSLVKNVTKKGSAYSLYRANQDIRSLRRYLASQGYPKARVQAQQSVTGQKVDVRFNILEGPRLDIAYEGASVPANTRSEVLQIWMIRSSDALALRDSIRRLLRDFRSDGFLQAKVSSVDRSFSPRDRRFLFRIDPGRKFAPPSWVFMGAEPMNIDDSAGVVMESPEAFKDHIESYYRSQGYLDAMSTTPKLTINQDVAHFEVTIDRGETYYANVIKIEGNQTIDEQQLREAVTKATAKIAVTSPPRFTSAWLDAARQAITSEYWRQGFNDVQVVSSTIPDRATAQTTVRFTVSEGEPQRIEAIDISGAMTTNASYIRQQFRFKEGDPLDYTKVNLTQMKLYDTQVFRHVDIEMAPGTLGYTAKVRLTEVPPWQLRYGINLIQQLQTGEQRAGLEVDLLYNSLFGRGITTGITVKGDNLAREVDVFASQPQFRGRPVTSTVTFFRTRDLSDPEQLGDYWGGIIQQSWKLPNRWLFFYDYSYRKVRITRLTDVPVSPQAVQSTAAFRDAFLDNPKIPIARLNTAITRDTRDDLLNSKHGSFFANNFEIAPPGIGSSIVFARNYTQYLFLHSYKNGLVSASGVRFGAAAGIAGRGLDPTIQFRTGGSTTVRAFNQEQLTVLAGNYVLVLNQEVRYPVYWKFSGAAFVDAGQVTNKIPSLFNLRWGPGVGVRFHLPFVLLRTDFAVNVKPRLGEPPFRWSFAIGQIF